MRRTILTNANLLDGRTSGRAGMAIAIEGDRITDVGTAEALVARPDDDVHDLTGMSVMPGLIPCHLHLEYDATGESLHLLHQGTERPHGVAMAYAIRNARTILRGGATSAIMAGCAYNIDAELQIAIAEGVAEGPELRACSPHLNATGGVLPSVPWWFDAPRGGLEQGDCTGPNEFRRAVREAVARGAQVIKLIAGGHGFGHRGLRTLSHDELVAAIEAAHERGALVRCHLAYREDILEAIAAGIDIVDHGDELDDDCIEAMAAHGTTFAATPVGLLRAVEVGRVPRAVFDRFAGKLRDADVAGVNLVFGDDYGHTTREPFTEGLLGLELALWVEEVGIDPLSAIRIGTANGAVAGRFDAGVVEVGRRADLLVVDGDPSTDIRLLADPISNVTTIKAGVFPGGDATGVARGAGRALVGMPQGW